jgi:hypothetical protein
MTSRFSGEAQQVKDESAASLRENANNPEYDGIARQFDDGETRKLLRKVDWRVLPILSLLYLLAFIDKSNLGNARVAGLEDDLAFTGTQYNLAATVCRATTTMETTS